MKARATSYGLIRLGAMAAVLAACVSSASAVEPPFTYQGQLKQGGLPVNNSADLWFILWDAPSGGTELADAAVIAANVTNGLFTVDVDFGPGAFDGSSRWLEIQVAVPSGAPFTQLAGRQLIAPAPYALFGMSAPWSGLTGMPMDIADGDDDSHLSESQVEEFVVNGILDLAAGSTVGGQAIAVGAHTEDTNAATLCAGSRMVLDGEGNCVPTGAGDGHSLDAVDGNPTDAVFVDAAGNVGVGIASPAHRLHVAGDAGFDQDAWFRSPTRFEIAHESNTGLAIDPELLSLTLEVDNTSVVTVTDTGVGIGTATPAEKLDVAGTIKMTGLHLSTTPTAGHVLTSDAFGIGTWQPQAGGGGSPWNLGQ